MTFCFSISKSIEQNQNGSHNRISKILYQVSIALPPVPLAMCCNNADRQAAQDRHCIKKPNAEDSVWLLRLVNQPIERFAIFYTAALSWVIISRNFCLSEDEALRIIISSTHLHQRRPGSR